MRVAIIPADTEEPMRFEEIDADSAYDFYNRTVGGLIEAVRLRDNELSVAMDYYVNEDFIAEGLPFNPRATALYELSFSVQGYMCGNAVVIGGVDAHGNDVGLNQKQENHLLSLFGTDYLSSRFK
jgi:Domain of unknown function (DUF3846)